MTVTPSDAWRIDDSAPKPASFNAEEWLVLKATGRRVHARHESGVERKLPKHWFD
jgi:hypothetical protein